jgi:hypothetical protein
VVDRRQESGTGSLPERARREDLSPPYPPARHCAAIDANGRGQLPYPWLSHSVPHHRRQHHDGGEIDLAAEKTQRRWRCPAAAAVHRTAEAEALVMLRADRTSTAARLAPIAGGMHYAAAQRAARVACRIGKVPIEGKQKIVESGIGQQRLVQSLRPPQQIVGDDGESRTQ